MGECFIPRHCRDPQKCPGGDGPGQAASACLGGWRWRLCRWILSVAVLKGGDACLHRSFFKRLLKVVLVAVSLEAAGCAGGADSAGCSIVTTCTPGPVLSLHWAGPWLAWEGCVVPAKGRERDCSHPHHPHQFLLILQLSCTSQASFNVACLSLFELLFGIKQNNQRFVMFPALNRVTKLKKQLKYLWLTLFCVQCAGVNAKCCC